MVSIIKLTKNTVIVVETPNKMPEDMAEKVLAELEKVFPFNKVLLPNGAKIVVMEPEQ